ncbi:hypothetical protein [Streptomyces sp. 35G-GA-8]|uniref:hypothetical protein n=1 Tax=Streptomyces sp. 35G-GA-8 TaxID=2939434 RepID=UPI00201E84D3|nr:hypothetical protein [Streptomyces sp. 35G-GA-8]MCL7379902.1 hypothetical protein [Streptomyces sp. 35G-GA-8]
MLTERCLEGRDVSLDFPDTGPEPPDSYDNSRRYGVADDRAAALYGYHLPEGEGSRDSGATTGWGEALSAEEEAALYGTDLSPGCYRHTDSLLARGVPEADLPWFADQSAETLVRTENDPTVTQARKRWRTCMNQAGHPYTDPSAAIGDPRWNLEGPTITEREKKTARTDVRCKQSSGLLSNWHAAETALQRQLIARHADTFEALSSHKRALLKNVLAVLNSQAVSGSRATAAGHRPSVFRPMPPLFSGADEFFAQADIAAPEPAVEQTPGGEPEP